MDPINGRPHSPRSTRCGRAVALRRWTICKRLSRSYDLRGSIQHGHLVFLYNAFAMNRYADYVAATSKEVRCSRGCFYSLLSRRSTPPARFVIRSDGETIAAESAMSLAALRCGSCQPKEARSPRRAQEARTVAAPQLRMNATDEWLPQEWTVRHFSRLLRYVEPELEERGYLFAAAECF